MPRELASQGALPLRLARFIKSIPRRSWWRLAWAAMLMLHAPITLNAFAFIWRDNGATPSWSSVLLLAGSNLFFILEIAFACSFRLVSDRRAALTMLLIVLLLHVGVFERMAPAVMAAMPDIRVCLTCAAAATVLARALAYARAVLIAALVDIQAALQRRRLRYPALAHAQARRRRLMACLAAVPPRAPPVLRG